MLRLPLSVNTDASCLSYPPSRVNFLQPADPLGAFFRRNEDPEYSRQALISPLSLAAAAGESEVIRFLHRHYPLQVREDLDSALFLANRQGKPDSASLLLDYGARPAEEFTQSGIHGAAWRGLNQHMKDYVDKHQANPDVYDGSLATPIVYAILGVQDEQGAWETIKCLFELGASHFARFSSHVGSERLSYAEIAQQEGKNFLARKLEEVCCSPTVLNSSRESSCTVERGDDVRPNKRACTV